MKCRYCGKSCKTRQDTIDHIEKYHSDELVKEGLDAPQAYWLTTHTGLTGRCLCGCNRETPWNYKTGKPCKVYPSEECRKRIRETYKSNMKRTHNGRITLLDDPEQQRKMQKSRHIAGKYKFPDGGEVDYLGKLEMNWLMFCDKVLDFTSNMIVEPPEYFKYLDKKTNTMRTYMPDYYLPDYNLLVEIKDGGNHPNGNKAFQDTTRYKVEYKEDVMRNQDKYNYIRVSGTNYGPFVEALYQIVHEQQEDGKPRKALVLISEAACVDIDDEIDYDQPEEIDPDSISLLVGYIENSSVPSYAAISDSAYKASWIVSDYESRTMFQASHDHPIFQTGGYEMYRYIGDKETMQSVFNLLVSCTTGEEECGQWDIIYILGEYSIYFTNGSMSNNHHRKTDFIMTERYFV